MAEEIKQKHANGNLVFYEGPGPNRTTTGYDLLSISPTLVQIGSSSNDIDLKVLLGSGTEYALFDAGNSRLTMNAVGAYFTNAALSRAIDIQITPTTADRQLYMDIDYGSNAKEAAYVIASSAKTSGETTAVRARGQGKATGGSTAEIRGVHAQGIAFSALYAGTVNAIYAEAIAKGTSTVVTLRGAMIACDSEGTPTSITNMYGAHIRVKTSVAPGTTFIGCLIETEKFGGGVKADSLLALKTSTWTNGQAAVVAVIDMSAVVGKSDCHIRFGTAHTPAGTTTEGDFWYDPANNVLKFYNGSAEKTISTN